MSEETKPNSSSDPDLDFILGRLFGHKTLLLAFAILGPILAVGVTAVLPPVYEAKTTIIMPAGGESGSAALGLAASLGVLPSGADSSGASLNMFSAILDSERMIAHLHEKTKIEKKDLRKSRAVLADGKANLIVIKFKDKDSNRALDLCNYSLEALSEFNSELSLPTKEQDANRLHTKLEETEDQVRDLELRFQSFARKSKSIPTGLSNEEKGGANLFTQKEQLKNLRIELGRINTAQSTKNSAVKTLRIEQGQTPTDIPQLQSIYEEFRTEERALLAAKAQYTDENPIVKELQSKVNSSREQIRREAGRYSSAIEQGLVSDLKDLDIAEKVVRDQIRELEIQVEAAPEEATEYERLRRELKVKEGILLDLTLRYEQALMEQTTDPNRWEILDEPQLADKPVNKRFALTAGLGFFISLFIGLCTALVLKPRS